MHSNIKPSDQWKGMVCAFLLAFLFFTPDGFYYLELDAVLKLYNVGTYLVFIFLAFIEAHSIIQSIQARTLKLDKTIRIECLLVLLSIGLLISSFLNDGSIKMTGDCLVVIWGAFLFVRYGVNSSRKGFLCGLVWTFFIFSIINFIGILAFYRQGGLRPGGDYWLFGQKNAMRNILFPAIGFSAIQDAVEGKAVSVRTVVLMVVSFVSILLADSKTSLLLIVLLIALILATNICKRYFAGLREFSVLYLAAEIILVWIRDIPVLSYVAVEILGKSATLNGRYTIWDQALSGIAERPLFGTGLHPLAETGLSTSSRFMVSHAHNALLDIFYKGGIICGVILIVIVFLSCFALYRKKTNPAIVIAGIVLGVFFIAGTVGELWNFGFFVVLFFSLYAEEFTGGTVFTPRPARRRKNLPRSPVNANKNPSKG